MGRRTLLLIAALVVAALGTTGVFLYVNGVDERAQAGLKKKIILVANSPITAGTTAQKAYDDGALERREFWQKSIEGLDALSDISGIADQVALANIAPGSPIVAGLFGEPGSVSQLPIPEDKSAVSIQLSDPERVAGFVEPGSRVAVYLTFQETNGANAGLTTTRALLPEVEVIAVGQTTLVPTTTGTGETAQTEQIPKTILTLAVDQKQAQQIIQGQNQGDLYFTLLGQKFKIDSNDSGTSEKNLF
jgi:pilus assembly protein CpaB